MRKYARRLRIFFVWSKRPLYEYKARAKTENLLQSRRSRFSQYCFKSLYMRNENKILRNKLLVCYLDLTFTRQNTEIYRCFPVLAWHVCAECGAIRCESVSLNFIWTDFASVSEWNQFKLQLYLTHKRRMTRLTAHLFRRRF